MSAESGRQIIVADEDLSRLAWLVDSLRSAGNAVFPVTDAESVMSIARTLHQVDLLVASPDLPSACGLSFRELVQQRLKHVRVVYWDPSQTGKAEAVERLLSH